MKTTSLFFLGVLGIFCSFMNVQAQLSTGWANANVTSFGSGAGVTTVATSGSSFFGYQAGNNVTGTKTNARNSFFGDQAGKNITTGALNTFLGYSSGIGNILNHGNTYVGTFTGQNNLGSYNVSMGYGALTTNNTSTNYTVAIGNNAGGGMTGNNNALLGSGAGQFMNGSDNVLIGYNAGISSYGSGPYTGSGNVLIGNNVGGSLGLSNKLFIDNTGTTTPLIWGDFALDQVKLNGRVGIGAVGTFPTTAGSVNVANYRLFVTGGILTDEVRVNLSAGGTWADYVFNKDYNLKTLAEVEQFIADKGHLPNVPSAQVVKENGIALGEMAKIQQEKIEELTLYLIQQNKEIAVLKAQMQSLLEKK
ncbi:MAG: hypothetical protein IPN80_04320 [Flavobacterium sp.]|nr:hypothetical protein [Flavobacterium sp.]